jgi:hypothetical protein
MRTFKLKKGTDNSSSTEIYIDYEYDSQRRLIKSCQIYTQKYHEK